MKNKAAKIWSGRGANNHYVVYTKDRDITPGNMEAEFLDGPEYNQLSIEKFHVFKVLLSKSEAKTLYRVLHKAFGHGEKQRAMKSGHKLEANTVVEFLPMSAE